MKVKRQPGSFAAVGLLILQLVLVARAQMTVLRPHGAAMAQAATERSPDGWSRSQVGGLKGEGATEPGKAGDTGDPALGGERHPLYRLSKLDVAEVNFALSPEFNQT